MVSINELRKVYHSLLEKEYERYESTKNLKNVFLTNNDLEEYPKDVIQELFSRGFLLKLGEDKYRTIHMDIATRSIDVRSKYFSNRRSLEYDLKLKKVPVLRKDYLPLKDSSNPRHKEFFSIISETLEDEHLARSIIDSLVKSGIKGLSRYQADSIRTILRSGESPAVISAPTGFGKTLVYFIPILVEALKAKVEKTPGPKAVLFYTRKTLESDQMSEMISILYHLNQILPEDIGKITIAIDDGNTKWANNIEDGELFRGIRDPITGKQLKIRKTSSRPYVEINGEVIDWILVDKGSIRENPPDILITNIWAYQYKLADPRYWESGYLSNKTKYFVFDEVHTYRGIGAGILRYFIRSILSLLSPRAKLILSSATIPRIKEFVQEITGYPYSNFVKAIYDKSTHGFDHYKYELYLLLGITPGIHWGTYLYELAIYLGLLNRLQETAKKSKLQTIIFVDSIKEIDRLKSQTYQAITLADDRIKPHLDNRRYPDPTDPFVYWVYNPQAVTNEKVLTSLIAELEKKIEHHYSSRADRYEIEERLKRKDIDVIYATNTLELGVNYSSVSVVVNAGIPLSKESILQRMGRAGRHEKDTLNTALGIIIIRNNPLEYYYLYTGIEELLNLSNARKIPVSYNNHFVILFSSLLHSIFCLSKKKKIKTRIKISDQHKTELVNVLKTVWDFYMSNKKEIQAQLGFNEFPEKLEERFKKVIEHLQQPDMASKCNRYRERTQIEYLLSEIVDIKTEIYELIEKIEEVSSIAIDKELLESRVHDIKSHLKMKTPKELELLRTYLNDLRQKMIGLGEYVIRVHKDLGRELYEIEERILQLSIFLADLDEIQTENDDDLPPLLFITCDFIDRLNSSKDKWGYVNIINVIEELIGFKFLGIDFIEEKVRLNYQNSRQEDVEEYLTSVIARIPPFEVRNYPYDEPDQLKITQYVGGRYLWLIRPKSYKILTAPSNSNIRHQLRHEGIYGGLSTRYSDFITPQKILLLDLLENDPIIMKITCKDDPNRPLFIKYGSQKITNAKFYASTGGVYKLKDNVRRLKERDKHKWAGYNKTLHATLHILNELKEESKKLGYPGIMLNYISYCNMGYAVSTDPWDVECPEHIKKECPLFKKNKCDGKRNWNTFRNIFPRVYLQKKVKIPPEAAPQENSPPLFLRFKTIQYHKVEDNPLVFYYDSVSFPVPASFVSEYRVREFDIQKVGYYAVTSMILLEFNVTFLDLILKEILSSDSIRDLILFKMFMDKYSQKRPIWNITIRDLSKFAHFKDEISQKELEEFSLKVLLHTLAHRFLTYLSAKYGVEMSKLLYHLDPNKGRIFIIENSKNDGLGIVETFEKDLQREGIELFYEFINKEVSFFRKHDRSIESHRLAIQQEYSEKLSKLIRTDHESENINKVKEEIESFNKNVSKIIPIKFLGHSLYRHLLLNSTKSPTSEESRPYLSLIQGSLGTPHLCYDGCNACLIFEKGCTEPFRQEFTISKQVYLRFLEILRSGSLSIPDIKEFGKYFKEFLMNSEEAEIIVPFIDKAGIKLLEEALAKGIKIRLTTRSSTLKQIPQHIQKKIEITVRDDFHSKVYTLKQGDITIRFSGSVNLNTSSLFEKSENITIEVLTGRC